MELEGFFVSDTPRFVKSMVKEYLDRGKMEIPAEFMRKYGNDLPDLVLLKARSGASFEVRLEDAEGGVWLGEGWRQFQDYYSLEAGWSLYFEMEGNDILHVAVFDESGDLIGNPSKDSDEKQSEVADEDLPSETEEAGNGSPVESADAPPVESADAPPVVRDSLV